MYIAKGLSLINHQFIGKITGLRVWEPVFLCSLCCVTLNPGYLGYSLYNEVIELEAITELFIQKIELPVVSKARMWGWNRTLQSSERTD